MLNFSTLKRIFIANWSQWLPIVCAAFFSILVLLNVWQIIEEWFFSSNQTSSATEVVPTNPPADETKIPITAVPQWHIFGLAPNEVSRSDELPSTTLRLQLLGIMQANDPAYSQAVIAGPDGNAEIYQVGAKLPGGAKIKQILPYSVILERAGMQEKLDLPRKILEISPAPQPIF